MDFTAWKAFTFFDLFPVTLEEQSQRFFADPRNAKSIATSPRYLFATGQDRSIHVFSPSFKFIRSFVAHADAEFQITHIKYVAEFDYLVTAMDGPRVEMRVWKVGAVETQEPQKLSTTVPTIKGAGYTISAFAVHPKLKHAAFGFTNGAVVLVQGDLVHGRGAGSDEVIKGQTIITGLDFWRGQLAMFALERIVLLDLSAKRTGRPPRVLSDTPCNPGCMTVHPQTEDLVVAGPDKVSYFTPNNPSEYLTFKGPKQSADRFQHYIVILSPDPAVLTIFQPDLRFIAHRERINTPVRAVFSDWGDLFALTDEGSILRFHQKTANQRLDILFNRNLYHLAIGLAKSLNLDEKTQNVIYRKYGDYLYSKQDYDTAMQQYFRAITCTEPSQVIRKFLDAQRVHNLVDYLEELHYNEMATAEHTTLLLNCYAKLKDVTKLERFLKSPGELKYDLDTAISMCRQGGYFTQADFLARKFEMHDVVVDVLVTDSKKYVDALDYIVCLDPDTAYRNMTKFASVLLDHAAEETTDFLIDFYTGKYRPRKTAGVLGPAITYEVPKPRTAFSSFLNHPRHFTVFLEACSKSATMTDDDLKDVYTTLFEMYLHRSKSDPEEKDKWEEKAKALLENESIPIDRSNALLLSDLERFRAGTTIVREQEGLRFDIFRLHAAAKDTAAVVQMVEKYGTEEPQLYGLALRYFVSSADVLAGAKPELGRLLEKIDRAGLMAPLQVVQTLASGASASADIATIGLIKPYLQSVISRQQTDITRNRAAIATARAASQADRAAINKLTTEPVTIKTSECSSCRLSLDGEIVHFLCGHSYHRGCINDVTRPEGVFDMVQRDLGLGLTTIDPAGSANPVWIASGDDDHDGPDGSRTGDVARRPKVPAMSSSTNWTSASGKKPETTKLTCYLCFNENKRIRDQVLARHDAAKNQYSEFVDQLGRSHDPVGTVATWFGKGVL